jgi:hypothetical protein
MRLALIGTAVVLCAVAVGVRAHRHAGPRHRPPQQVAQALVPRGRQVKELPREQIKEPIKEPTSWTVTGWGKSVEDANQVAAENARKAVSDYLDHQQPPIRWRPSTDYVKRLAHWSQPEAKDLPDLGKMYEQTVTVELDAKHYREILENDRQERVEQRHLLLGKVVGGLLVVLLAVFGYFRLEEMTRGYYTLWLRLGAVALVGVAAALLLVVA